MNLVDTGYVIKDLETKEYYCGYNHWDEQLRKSKIYHSTRYVEKIMRDKRFSMRNLCVKCIRIEEV